MDNGIGLPAMNSPSDASTAKTALVVLGSTRAGRICPQVAAWVAQLGREHTTLDYEIVDLADWPLPADDEPAIPALGPYAQAHTRAWSDRIARADALVFVAPQFNWGYPAVLKNAIDHLYSEWRDKPLAIVSYGGHGGTRCAKQLRQVAASLHMRIVPAAPALPLSDAVIREGAALEPARDFRAQAATTKRALAQLEALAGNREPRAARAWRKARTLFFSLR